MSEYRIVEDDAHDPAIVALLEHHFAEMRGWSPPEQCHVLPVAGLREPGITLLAAWDGEALAAIGALREIDAAHGELKSMRAAPAYRRRGAGDAILRALIAEARRRGYRWLGLETGRTGPFAPAVSLYAKYGFSECAPFGTYLPGDFSMCMSRAL